jgi:hemolysin activation/secretion protein
MKVAERDFRKLIPPIPASTYPTTARVTLARRVTKWLNVLAFSLMLTAMDGFGADIQPVVVAAPAPDRVSSDADAAPAERIVDGKVRIRRVELRGEVLFPEYGITNDYIRQRLHRAAQTRSPWMSISDMHRLADSLTLAYHEKGLTFNQVFVLPQEIRDETLTLNVQAGRLAEVNVMNNALYTRDQLSDPFAPLLGRVIYEPAIRQVVAQLNAMPGLKVFGFYSVGRRQGETRLNLRVQTEEAAGTSVRLDNWGVQNTGAARVTLSHSRNNLAGLSDQLQMLVMMTDESGNLYGGIHYNMPLNRDTRLHTGISRNQFEIAGDLAQFGLEGHLLALQGSVDTALLTERTAKASAQLNIAAKQSVVSSSEFRDVFEEELDYVTLEPGLRASVLRQDIRVSQGLYVAPMIGHLARSNSETVERNFWGVRLNYSLQHLWSPTLIKGQLTTLNLNFLVTESVIPDAERMSLTGAAGVRGFEPALFSADQTYRLALEHTITGWQSLAGTTVAPFAFLDAVHGEQNDGVGNTASFMAAGFGLDIERKKQLSGRITLGFPLHEDTTAILAEEDFKPVIYGQIGLQF